MSQIEDHKALVHWGDWHVVPMCLTCGWGGEVTSTGRSGNRQHEQVSAHIAKARRRTRRALLWARLTGRKPVVHRLPYNAGDRLQCCGKHGARVSGLDTFTKKSEEVTCR